MLGTAGQHGDAFGDVAAVIADYFDGLHHSDAARLARVFHPEAHYFCATDGTLLHLDMASYFPMVEQRPAPANQGHARTDKILSMQFAGPVTAFVTAECAIPPKHFTDFLTLVKLQGRWQIVAKAFHYVSR